MKKNINDMCPVCAMAIENKNIVVEAFEFINGKPENPRYIHVDCALYISAREERNHPPEKA